MDALWLVWRPLQQPNQQECACTSKENQPGQSCVNVSLLAQAQPGVQLAVVAFDEGINSSLDWASIAVEVWHALAWNIKPTAAQLCDEFRAIAATCGAV